MKYPKPKISVIIPAYNTAAYLLESVGSISGQSLIDLEIIVIDDGSTDDTPKVLSSLSEKDDRIIVITQENAGQSVARNKGIDIAKGDFIYFMDSDDLLDTNALEECYNKCISDSLDMVIFNGESFFEDKFQKPIFDYNITNSLTDEIYLGADLFIRLASINRFTSSPCLYLIRREIIENRSLRFYPRIIHEDNLFTALAYIYCSRIGILEHTYFKRRIRGNSTMTSKVTWKNITGYLTTSSEILRISQTMTIQEKAAVNVYVSSTMTAVCYKARQLCISERIKYIKIMLMDYLPYVPFKEIFKVLFPKR